MMLVPYGHTTAHLGNYNDLIVIGQKALAKLKERYGTSYTLGNIAETICKKREVISLLEFECSNRLIWLSLQTSRVAAALTGLRV